MVMHERFRWKYATDAEFGARVNQRRDAERRERQQKKEEQITLGHCNDCKMDVAVEYGLWTDDGQAQVRCVRCDGHNAKIQ